MYVYICMYVSLLARLSAVLCLQGCMRAAVEWAHLNLVFLCVHTYMFARTYAYICIYIYVFLYAT